jgi:hypothetical protein
VAGFRIPLPRSGLHDADKGFGLGGRRCTLVATEAVDGKVKGISGRQPLHDERFRSFIDIGWACTGQIRTRHSDKHIGRAAIS